MSLVHAVTPRLALYPLLMTQSRYFIYIHVLLAVTNAFLGLAALLIASLNLITRRSVQALVLNDFSISLMA
jgi:hypothetical protein